MTNRIVHDWRDGSNPLHVHDVILRPAGESHRLACVFVCYAPGGPEHWHVVDVGNGPEAEGAECGSGEIVPLCPALRRRVRRVVMAAYRAALTEAGEAGQVAA